MSSAPIPTLPTSVPFVRTRRPFIASILGVVAGAGTIGGMWLPLANLAGMGPVRFFEYDHTRAFACITMAALVIVFSIVRCFRLVLIATGVLCGLLAATGIELFKALHVVISMDDGALTQMARQMVANSSLLAGVYVIPSCCVACFFAGMFGSSAPRRLPMITSES